MAEDFDYRGVTQNEGKIPEAAEELGISRATLYRKIEQLAPIETRSVCDDSKARGAPNLPGRNEPRTLTIRFINRSRNLHQNPAHAGKQAQLQQKAYAMNVQ